MNLKINLTFLIKLLFYIGEKVKAKMYYLENEKSF